MDEHSAEAVHSLPEHSYGWGHVDCGSALVESGSLAYYASSGSDVYRVVRPSDESLWLWEHDAGTLEWVCFELAQFFYARALELQREEAREQAEELLSRGTIVSIDFAVKTEELEAAFGKFSSALAEAGEKIRVAFAGTWVTRSLKESTTLLDEDSEKENI